MTEQNIAACLILSAIGGMMGVLATAILAFPDAQKARGNPWSPCAERLALLLSLLFQVGIAFATITATWYGPVSIVVPTSSSAQLLFNMVMFGVFLGLESFSKAMRVGAYVVVLAAILLPVVGPGTQEDQDILELLKQTGSIVWSSILLASLALSAVGLVLSNMRRKKDLTSNAQDSNMFIFNLVAQTSGAVVGTTVAKMFVLVTGAALGVSVALWLVSSLILVYATVLQATTVSQGKFVPLSVGTKIGVNAITGIIIWEDWRVVTSWIGYVCVFLYLMLGNYLLCDVDVFGAQNATYGTAATLEKMKSAVFDPNLMKEHDSDDDEHAVEMQHLEESSPPEQQATGQVPHIAKSSSTEAADDWIPESDADGSEAVQSSSTAEADDYMSDRQAVVQKSSTADGSEAVQSSSTASATEYMSNREAVQSSSTDQDVARMEEAAEPSAAHEPKTVSSVWRNAYQFSKTKKEQQTSEEATDVDFDPKTASGVWRKAYHVEK